MEAEEQAKAALEQAEGSVEAGIETKEKKLQSKFKLAVFLPGTLTRGNEQEQKKQPLFRLLF